MNARSKGRRGQQQARDLLTERDYSVAELNAGTSVEDFLAIDTNGNTWSVEVKNTKAITTAHRDQAMKQGKSRRLPWMLISHISGTSFWLIQRQGMNPVVWGKE